jgi:hypothetical protein
MADDIQKKITDAEANLAKQKKEFQMLFDKAKEEKSKIDKMLEEMDYTEEKGKEAFEKIPKEQADKIEKFAAALLSQHDLPGTPEELEKFAHHEANKISIEAGNPLKDDKIKKSLSRRKKLV